MRRRLDLAASMIGRPEVLFLDEPTTGLDPRTRNEVWDEVKRMVGDGVTVLLTTQYMEEAEQLASELTVVDRGKVIAGGGIEELKAKVGGRTLRDPPGRPAATAAARRLPGRAGHHRARRPPPWTPQPAPLLVPILSDEQLTAVVGAVTARGITIASITTELPSLDEVFLVPHRPPRQCPAGRHARRRPRRGRRMSAATTDHAPRTAGRRPHRAARPPAAHRRARPPQPAVDQAGPGVDVRRAADAGHLHPAVRVRLRRLHRRRRWAAARTSTCST